MLSHLKPNIIALGSIASLLLIAMAWINIHKELPNELFIATGTLLGGFCVVMKDLSAPPPPPPAEESVPLSAHKEAIQRIGN